MPGLYLLAVICNPLKYIPDFLRMALPLQAVSQLLCLPLFLLRLYDRHIVGLLVLHNVLYNTVPPQKALQYLLVAYRQPDAQLI